MIGRKGERNSTLEVLILLNGIACLECSRRVDRQEEAGDRKLKRVCDFFFLLGNNHPAPLHAFATRGHCSPHILPALWTTLPLNRGFLKFYCFLRLLHRLKNAQLLRWPFMCKHWQILPLMFSVPGNKFSVVVSGNTNGTHGRLVSLIKTANYFEVPSPQESDFLLVFCPVVSRVGTDIGEALQNMDRKCTPAPSCGFI